MRGTSPVPFSYSPAMIEWEAPMPSGGITRPACPLPMNGEGTRAGSVLVRRYVESRVVFADALCASSAPAKTARAAQTIISATTHATRALNLLARDGGADFARHP